MILASVIWFQEPSFWKRKDMFIISCKIIFAFRFPPNIWHSHTWHFCLKVVVPHFAQTVCWQCAPIKHSHRDLQRLCVWEGFLGFLQFYPAKQSCVYWNYLIPAKLMRCDEDIALYFILGGKKLQKEKKFPSYWAFEWKDHFKVKRYKFFFHAFP